MPKNKCSEDEKDLLHWYKSLSPLRVDIVGDFAGKELFAIHGDSLMLHCVTNARVDYTSMLAQRLLLGGTVLHQWNPI